MEARDDFSELGGKIWERRWFLYSMVIEDDIHVFD